MSVSHLQLEKGHHSSYKKGDTASPFLKISSFTSTTHLLSTFWPIYNNDSLQVMCPTELRLKARVGVISTQVTGLNMIDRFFQYGQWY